MGAADMWQVKDASPAGVFRVNAYGMNMGLAVPKFPVYYKMRGFNASTQLYETWMSSNPNVSGPPNGDILTNICIADIIRGYLDFNRK